MNKVLKSCAVVAAVAGSVIAGSQAFAWGPASRDTYTIANPADKVVFNSITDNPKWGDERDFAHIREVGTDKWVSRIDLKPGKTYDVMVYYHNNASESLNGTNYNGTGVARGAFVRVEFPSYVDGETYGNVVLGASNADPAEVWDSIIFNSDRNLALRYVSGTAKLQNFASATPGTTAERTFNLPDEFLSVGTPIGFDAMDGVLPGCNRYSGVITFQVAVPDPNMKFTKHVGVGSEDWAKSGTAKPGDIVEFELYYMNIGNVNQNNVVISDTLPKGLTYVPGSTMLYTPSNPDGRAVADGVTTTGINVGSYAPGAEAYVTFQAKIADNDDLEVCGANTLRNMGSVDTANGGLDSFADVLVNRECEPDEPGEPETPETPEFPETPKDPEMPKTGAAPIIGGVAGLGAIGTAVAYYVTSRRGLKIKK